MKPPKRFILLIICLFAPLLVVACFVWNGDGYAPSDHSDHMPLPPAAPTSPPASDVNAHALPTSPPVDSSTPAASNGEAWTLAWMTDTKERQILWQEGQRMIFAQDLHLYYASGGTAKQLLYEWTLARPAQAWLNGNELLIGTQLTVKDATGEGDRGSWLAVRIAAESVAVAPPSKRSPFFGPQDILSMGIAKEPHFFDVKWRNQSGISESVFDPSCNDWVTVNGDLLDTAVAATTGGTPDTYALADARAYPLPGGTDVYAFADKDGIIVYYRNPHYFVVRYRGYELQNVQEVKFLEGQPQLMGLFRKPTGEQFMSFLYDRLALLPVEPRLWQGDWQALDENAFTQASSDKLEVIQFIRPNDAADAPAKSRYTQFPTNGGKLLSAHGSLLQYEFSGEQRTISWYDLIHTEGAKPQELWSSPLPSAAKLVFRQEQRPQWSPGTSSHELLALPLQEENTNAPIPEKLHQAVNEAYPEDDYSYAKTYRKRGSQWFVLVNRDFYEFKAGSLVALGEMPITLGTVIGEAAGGLGARDFVLLKDGGWLVADTEASRVVKLSDKLKVEAELGVPYPYQLTLKGKQVEIASLAQCLTADTDLLKVRSELQPFAPTVNLKKQQVDGLLPQEWYRDEVSGLTWYTRYGFLYQYQEQQRQYRAFYLGENRNAIARVRILPYKDEVIVLLDHRLERFDRHGNWLSTLSFPRAIPDGIYDSTPLGENSLIMDEASGMLYMVQGYRILGIDLARNEAETVFRQNYADLGELASYKGSLYFLLNSNLNDRYRQMQADQTAKAEMTTELVRFDLQTHTLRRFAIKGYYDALTIEGGSGTWPELVLHSYN